jgi:predicted nucleic acid-binding protein
VRAVFDANIAVFALLERRDEAVNWFRRLARLELDVSVPDLLFAEVGQALAGHVRAGDLARELAVARLDFLHTVPFDVRPLELLAAPALGLALARDLSVYDACYAVLAEAEDAVLVTGDVRLAESTRRAELVR